MFIFSGKIFAATLLFLIKIWNNKVVENIFPLKNKQWFIKNKSLSKKLVRSDSEEIYYKKTLLKVKNSVSCIDPQFKKNGTLEKIGANFFQQRTILLLKVLFSVSSKLLNENNFFFFH